MCSSDLEAAVPHARRNPHHTTKTGATGATGATGDVAAAGWVDCGGSFGRPVHYTRIVQDERVTVYPHLIGKIKIMIFNGDQDNCIPYTQDEAWTAGMGLGQLEGWRPWMVDRQVGGYVVAYEHNFTFATVKGAGHLCPRYQPERSLALLTRFLAGTPL